MTTLTMQNQFPTSTRKTKNKKDFRRHMRERTEKGVSGIFPPESIATKDNQQKDSASLRQPSGGDQMTLAGISQMESEPTAQAAG
jgi:hypothetical protein